MVNHRRPRADGDTQAVRHAGGYMTRWWPPASSAGMSRRALSAICSTSRLPRSRPARSSTSWPSPSCRWPRTSTSSISPARRSTGHWSATWRAAPYLAKQRDAVLIGGTGTGKSHLAIAIAGASIRGGARGRFYTVVDLTSSIGWRAKPAPVGRAGSPII